MPEPIEDVAIVIEGNRWRSWSSIQIKRSIDSFTTVEFESPFEWERIRFRDNFQPFSFKNVNVRVGDEQLLTGILLDTNPDVTPDSRTVHVGVYSLPAILNDVCMPASSFPLELNGLQLRRIAETLVRPFGLDIVMDASDGAPFRRVKIEPEAKVFEFLTGLAQQRNLIISDTPAGALRFLQSTSPGHPVAVLREGEPPLIHVQAQFSPQAYFSEITGIAKTRSGRGGAKHTLRNPHLTGELRPLTFKLEDTDGPDLPAAVSAKMGRMFGAVLSVSIELPTWRDPHGALWKPNTTLRLQAANAMLPRETEFLIREVTLKQEPNATSASLELVLPGAFSGEMPAELPWA